MEGKEAKKHSCTPSGKGKKGGFDCFLMHPAALLWEI
jgi:hypothetical protein